MTAKEIEKMNKDELKDTINNLNKRIEDYEERINYCIEKEDELNLLKFLYKDYVQVVEENRSLNNSMKMMEGRIIDLQDLCYRQQKIIDGKYE